MKSKLIIFSVILLISTMVAGGTFAWFTSSPDTLLTNGKMGTVKVKVIEKDLDDIRVKNIGTDNIYIRIRLIPQWTDPSLSVANVDININREKWIEKDGYYYYKYSIKENEETTNLIKNIDFGRIGPEYEEANFALKVVTEGVQSSHQAWKDVWGINKLPF